jgi:hypothetical protein
VQFAEYFEGININEDDTLVGNSLDAYFVTGVGLQRGGNCENAPGQLKGAPAPLLGAGLPGLGIAVGYGAYWLARRRRNKAV